MVGKIILASSSPRRADILKKHNVKFEIIPSPYVEDHSRTDFSYDFIENLAYNKAKAVVPLVKEPSLIIGADTIVVLDEIILGKPNDYNGAFDMLKMLSGRTHHVVTAIAVINSATKECKIKSTTSEVTFEELTNEQIKYYVENFSTLFYIFKYCFIEFICKNSNRKNKLEISKLLPCLCVPKEHQYQIFPCDRKLPTIDRIYHRF